VTDRERERARVCECEYARERECVRKMRACREERSMNILYAFAYFIHTPAKR